MTETDKNTLPQEKIDALVEKKVIEMIKEDPTRMVLLLLCQMGKMAVEANAGEMEMKTEATIKNQRYQVKAIITATKIKKK